jgi:hypothetical protein
MPLECHFRTFSRQRGFEHQKRRRLRVERREQSLCFLKIGGLEALGKPAIDRREKVAGFGAAALVEAEPGEARLCQVSAERLKNFLPINNRS